MVLSAHTPYQYGTFSSFSVCFSRSELEPSAHLVDSCADKMSVASLSKIVCVDSMVSFSENA